MVVCRQKGFDVGVFLIPAAQNILCGFRGSPGIAGTQRQQSVRGGLHVLGGPYVAESRLFVVQALDLHVHFAFFVLKAANGEFARVGAWRECRLDAEQVLGRAITVAWEAAVQFGGLGRVQRLARRMPEAEDQKECENIAAH